MCSECEATNEVALEKYGAEAISYSDRFRETSSIYSTVHQNKRVDNAIFARHHHYTTLYSKK